MVSEGAAIIDVAESHYVRARAVSMEGDEVERVVPVIRQLAGRYGAAVSIDTAARSVDGSARRRAWSTTCRR
jgi:dihydropteroate synthase